MDYHFKTVEGDFTCRKGHVEFPVVKNNMMIEGVSMNFQIRNALVQDKNGALVIHSTRGPFQGNESSSSRGFSYEFIRYSPKSTVEQ